jgi:hypothetical protein
MNFTFNAAGNPNIKQNINNAIQDGVHAMPMKAGVTDNSADFSINRYKYIRTIPDRQTLPNKNDELQVYQQKVQDSLTKKYYLNTNRDSASRIANMRKKQVGTGSLNPPRVVYDIAGNPNLISINNPFSLIDTKNVNVIDQARRRVRSGGSVVPPKFRINKS